MPRGQVIGDKLSWYDSSKISVWRCKMSDFGEELKGWLTPTQAAARLGCSKLTVLRWADSGRLPVLRTPLGRLLRAEDVQALAAERERHPSRRGRRRREREVPTREG